MITQCSQDQWNKKCKHLPKKYVFNLNDDLYCVLIKKLETYSNAPLEYIVQVFNSSFNTNVTKTQVHNYIQ
jgi:hypothetical protein